MKEKAVKKKRCDEIIKEYKKIIDEYESEKKIMDLETYQNLLLKFEDDVKELFNGQYVRPDGIPFEEKDFGKK